MTLRHCRIAVVLFLISYLGYVLTECPLGWRQYNSSCYVLSSKRLSWYNAESYCQEHGARLIEIETKEQQDSLTDLAKRFYSKYNFWLGGKDEISENRWIWSSTNHSIMYKNWGIGEPNGGKGENCLAMYGFWTYTWYDMGCSYLLQFVCEKSYQDGEEIIG
ncbi:perlucin-like protein [Mytilus galloprovincialis]|uniref:perlucin-like protein n=1 Tax=Mytilus galloprovincialis TaxID=29158 RepID=UPI003F7C32B0